MKLLTRQRVIPVLTAAVLVIASATGLAIATPSDTKEAERSCAALYAEASSEYADCLAYKVGLVAGDTGSQPSAAKAVSTPRPPVRYCWQNGRYANEKIKQPKTCTKPITCLIDAAIGKYRCADAKGTPVNPPAPVCQTEARNYACDIGTASPKGLARTPTSSEEMIGKPTSVTSPAQAPPTIAIAELPSYESPPSLGESAGTPSPTPPAGPSTSASPTTSPTATSTQPPTDAVAQAIREAEARNLNIWLDTNLIPAWKAGPDQLRNAAQRLAAYAQLSPRQILGVKISYELGTRGELRTADEIRRFVTETSAALRTTLPPGQQIAVDVAIPELGCGSHKACITAMRTRYPLLTLGTDSHPGVEQYILNGAIDTVWISHLPEADDSYDTWGISARQAWGNLWIALKFRAWESKGLRIGARVLGLAHHGDRSTVTADAAKKAVADLVDMPMRRGAQGVALWTWRQTFNNQTWRLADANLMSNAVWSALAAAPERRSRLSIAYNPSKPGQEQDIPSDIQVISSLATGILIFTP